MKQYIEKSALVAEIEKLINEIYAGRPFDSLSREQQVALWYVKSIMSSINTLEMKEVDLEKEIDNVWNKDFSGHFDVIGYTDFTELAKYFFELGMTVSNKAQKGEEV